MSRANEGGRRDVDSYTPQNRMLQDNKAAVVIGSIVLYRGQGPSLDALCQPVFDALCQPVVGALCQPVVDI